MKRKIIKDKLPSKVLTFDISEPEDVRLFHLLDKTRYNQSKLIKRLLSDFYDEFNITENTPSDNLTYIVKAYINRDETYNQYQVLNKILNRGSSSMVQQIMPAPVVPSEQTSMTQASTSNQPNLSASVEDEEVNPFIGNMVSGFDSMLE